VLLIFIYWIFWRYTSAMAVQGTMLPIVGAFAADIAGVIASIVLLKKAST
jgi:lipopolysaccharide export LptBFGC system permease protein LptF